MPAADRTDPPAPDDLRATRLHTLPRRTYRFRVMGMGLAAIAVSAVLLERGAGWEGWAWMVASCLLWPHLAYWHARRSRDPFRAELYNFVADSTLAGSWVPLMHFNLLPSVVLVTVVTADKVNSGVRNLWLWSLPWMLGGTIGAGWLTGFALAPATSQRMVLACLPIMVIHTLAVSLSSYKLIRRVQRQNLELQTLSRTDSLTGLDGRRHWQSRAEALLRRHAAGQTPATLVLVDIDRFKQINDRHGHAVGDDVLRAIAECLRAGMPAQAAAGRLGGDEFAIAVPADPAATAACAERLRAAVDSLEFPRSPGLRCSVSIGLAAAPDGGIGLREWTEAADRALYESKSTGRNRVHSITATVAGRPG